MITPTDNVILFKGSDCGPCATFEPIFMDALKDVGYAGKVQVEVDNFELMDTYAIRQVPAVVIVQGNKETLLVGNSLRIRRIKDVISSDVEDAEFKEIDE